MIELILVVLALVGGLSLIFGALAGLADYVLPAIEGKAWRINRHRPAATYRRKS